MVDRPPVLLEREDPTGTQTSPCNGDGCLETGVGSSLPGSKNRWSLVGRRTTMAHKLPGSAGGFSGCEMLCQRQERNNYSAEDGQHHSSHVHVHEQAEGYSLPSNERHSQGAMALVYEEGHHPSSRASTRNPQYYSGRGIAGDEGQDRLDAEPRPVCQDLEEIWPTRGGHVCLTADNSTQQVLQLETRPGSGSSECFCPGLGTPQRDRLCQPTVVADQQSSNTGTGSENLHHTGGTSMEITAVVPQAAGHADRLLPEDSDGGRRDLSNGSQQHASREPTTSCLEYLRHRFKNQQISEEGTELLLASWR